MDEDDELGSAPAPTQTQRNRRREDSPEDEDQAMDADMDTQHDYGSGGVQQLSKGLVRYALACEHARKPIKRAEINEKGEHDVVETGTVQHGTTQH